MKALLVLYAALAVITLGMAFVVYATVAPGVFFVGIYLIDAGLVALAVAAVLHLVLPVEPT